MKILRLTKYTKGVAVVAVAIFVMGFAVASRAYSTHLRVENSKLSEGRWVKISVQESGVYEITAATARSWGFNDLSKVHVFGFGGAQLSEAMRSDQPDDLPKLPLVRLSDKILFYAQGALSWTSQSGDVTFVQSQHPYATKGYYFVTDDSRFSDIEIEQSAVVPAGTPVSQFTERLYHEQEVDCPGESGRDFLGEDFSSNRSQTFKFNLSGAIEGQQVGVLTSFAAKTVGGSSNHLTFRYNETNLPASNSDKISSMAPDDDVQHLHYYTANSVKAFDYAGWSNNELSYNITFSPSGTLLLARLNYITVNYQRQLTLPAEGVLTWGQYQGTTDVKYVLGGYGDNTRVWDVTTPYQPVQMSVVPADGAGAFSPVTAGNREYVAFNESGIFYTPEKVGEVTNQDIHGSEIPDMIIISPTEYLAQAQRVADMHVSVDSMRVLVVDQKKVFNEFSSGTPDAMAFRSMCKMFYDRGADSQGHKLGYLLLFGAGSFDNRQISSVVKASSYPALLTWQTAITGNENTSYTSDDIFGVLADDVTADFLKYDIDIAVGRIPVRSVSDAKVAVDKLVKYVTQTNNGSWKNNVLLVADDENMGIHMEQTEAGIANAEANGGDHNIFNKVYLDAFTATSHGAGRYYPDARNKMFRLLDEGVIWWNYTGHASPNNWTGDGLLQHADIENNLYYKHLPILFTITCEFTRFDALNQSGGESLFVNPRGGAIAILGSPRLAFIGPNGDLHKSVSKYAYRKDAEGNALRLGDILRLGKNDVRKASAVGTESNNARFFLFGDPAMRPAHPTHKITLETINGEPVSDDNMPQFKARQTLTFAGKVTDAQGRAVDFNGPIVASLYDCEQSVVTHGYGEGKEYVFLERPNKLQVKVDTVKNGAFDFKMTVPSEILATFDNYSPSLINFYAYDNTHLAPNTFNGGSVEAMGSNSQFYIYGYDDTINDDTAGPTIHTMVLNDTDFKDGDHVNESPLLMARLSDESGINLSIGGIGHSLTLTLDETTTYDDVCNYFTPIASDNGEGSAGSINYALSNLEPGRHTLCLKAWDVFNNSSSKTIEFVVIKGLKPTLYDIYTDANPASTDANFYVTHNRPDANLTVGIDVYDLLGRLVWTTTQSGRSDSNTSFPVTWNLTDMTGARVPRGIYVYRARISTDGIQEATKAKKIAVTAP